MDSKSKTDSLRVDPGKEDPVAGDPYQDIYIYLINGFVSERDGADFGEAFIGNWVEDESSFLFFSRPSIDPISMLLVKQSDLEHIDEFHFTYEEWQGGGLEALRVERFLIIPPWEESAAIKGEIEILLDPGVVFGTGLHPTTRDCLRALARLGDEAPFESVLDLGTGTGILAIAAVRLGAGRILAVDLNPLSVKTARKNVAHNRLEDQIRVQQGRAEAFIKEPVDLVMANIHHDAMASLLKRKAFLQKNGSSYPG